MTDLIEMGKAAKAAGRTLATLTTDEKNQALMAIADEIEAQEAHVLAQNALDIEAGREKGLSDALLDRLLLTEKRIAALASDARDVATGIPVISLRMLKPWYKLVAVIANPKQIALIIPTTISDTVMALAICSRKFPMGI